MSVIDLTCPNCHASVYAPASLAGKSSTCRRCDCEVPVPADCGGPEFASGGAHEPVPGGTVGLSPGMAPSQARVCVPGGTVGLPQGAGAHEPIPGGSVGSPGTAQAPREEESMAFDSPFVRMGAPTAEDEPAEERRFEHRRFVESPPEPPDQTVVALIGASVGAVLGAVVWAGIGAVTGYEFGWIAWGIGAVVGGIATVLGGRGSVMAAMCALLTLLSIAGGKFIAVSYVVPREVGRMMANLVSREMYSEHKDDANQFAALGPAPSDGDVRDYMVRQGWFVEGESWEIPGDLVDAFMSENAPELLAFHEERPEYEVWRDRVVDRAVDEMLQEVSTIDILEESLTGYDLLWVFLGLSSAFGLVMRRS